MDPKFRKQLAIAHRKLRALIASTPVRADALPMKMPASRVYLFTEHGKHLYVGRSNRLKKRIPLHYRRASKHSSAAFAFRLARKATRREVASYKTEGSRKQLAADQSFARAFLRAKERIRSGSGIASSFRRRCPYTVVYELRDLARPVQGQHRQGHRGRG